MPIFLTLLRQFWYVVPIVILFLWGEYEHHAANTARKDLSVLQAQFDGFKDKIEAQGKQAKAEAKLKETQNAQAVTVAVAGRNDALHRLHVVQAAANSASRSLSRSPTAPAGSNQVCFDSAAYNAAFAKYRNRLGIGLDGIRKLAFEGDEAQIDGQALLKAWPK